MSYSSSRKDLSEYRKNLKPKPRTKSTSTESKPDNLLKKDYRHQLESALARLTALKHPDMRRILRAIAEEPMTVYEIEKAAGMPTQSRTSQYLSLLRASMLVKWERQGKHVYYSIDAKEIERCNELVTEFNLS